MPETIPSRREALFAAVMTGLLPRLSSAKSANHTLPVSQIEAVFGVSGTVESGGVLHFDFPRTDLSPSVMGISVDPDWGFDTEITFQPTDSGAIVKWELCLLDSEVSSTVDALVKSHLTPAVTRLNALHNHFILISPEVKFLHGTGLGDPVRIATMLYDALRNNTAQPFSSPEPPDTGLPNHKIASTIGGEPEASGKILVVSVDRADQFTELGVSLEPESQIEGAFTFQKIGTDLAIVSAEFPLLNKEVDAVAQSLVNNGFTISAVHNHELFIEPHLYYLHSAKTGNPLELAAYIRQALAYGNFELKS
jgi:hypothetical protein